MRARTRRLAFAPFLLLSSLLAATPAVSQEQPAEEQPQIAEPRQKPLEPSALPPLDAFVRGGRSKALSMAEARAIVEQREVEHEQAILTLLPSFTATASYTRNQYESTVDIPTGPTTTDRIVVTPQDQLDATFRVDVTFLDARGIRRAGAADVRVDAARLQLGGADLDTERAVTRAYWERVAAEAVERAALGAMATAEANVKMVAARHDVDLASDLDLERAKAAVDRSKQTLAEARLSRGLATRKLKSLTGIDASASAPEIAADVSSPAPLGTYAGRESGSALVRASAEEVRAAEIVAESSWLVLVPRLTGSFSERFTNASGFGESPLWALSLIAEWRVDPALIGAARTEAAVARVAAARHARTVQDAGDAIQDAWLEVEARKEAALAARSEAAAAKRGAAVARAQYEANKASQLDVIVAERDALQAEVARVQADANLELSRAFLRLAAAPAPAGEP
jgi:outer membrane protein TolC